MNSFREIEINDRLDGVIPGGPVQVVQLEIHGTTSATLTYRKPGGALEEQLVLANNLAEISKNAENKRSFAASGAEFKLALEAERIANSHFIDPFAAIAESSIEPYPHQIDAVYNILLQQHPIRFLLADDPGSGKTIMSGLLIKELMLRGSVNRCLVLAPGGLVEQWQDELRSKFELDFRLMSRSQIEGSFTGNPFSDEPCWIARVDQIARSDDMLARTRAVEWDLVIIDEAHKMSARVYPSKVEKTKRYELAEILRGRTRHFLLLSATPHSGKNDDFMAFMSLIDGDRFAGRLRPGEDVPDLDGVMRRVSKENLTDFAGQRLFPPREATTLKYELSTAEMDLYDKVTAYVRSGMAKALKMQNERNRIRGFAIGFALAGLQRRLASSPAAIQKSLARRFERLNKRLVEIRQNPTLIDSVQTFPQTINGARRLVDEFDPDDFTDAEREKLEDELLDGASAAQTVEELETELAELEPLVPLSDQLRRRGDDAKWRQLREAVIRANDVANPSETQKLIVFSEYVDTVEYLEQRLRAEFGRSEAVLTIHGKLRRHERREIQDRFRVDPEARVLLATDAAGEGVNLQAAHMVVNYDLPWNPNRIEQRFGRVHRIGQKRKCFLWNMVADGTREGQVFERLFEKIERIRKVVGDSVYDVLGDSQLNRSLRELLMRAISEADDPNVIEYMAEQLDTSFTEELQNALKQQGLAKELGQSISSDRIHREMERAKLRKLQPFHVQSFFLDSLSRFGGITRRREKGRFEIKRVPMALRSRRSFTGTMVHPRYGRITFEPQYVQSMGNSRADLITPTHTLTRSLVEAVRQKFGETLADGAVLIDPDNRTKDPRTLFCFEHTVIDGNGHTISKRFQYVELLPDGNVRDPGDTPHLNYEPINFSLVDDSIRNSVLSLAAKVSDNDARRWAIENFSHQHFEETQVAVADRVTKSKRLVRQRLSAEIRQLDSRYNQLLEREQLEAKNLNSSQVKLRADALEARLIQRTGELDLEAHLINKPPVVVAAAVVLPERLVASEPNDQTPQELRERTDRLAIEATMETERALGRNPVELKHNNPGYDILSRDPRSDSEYFIEVKGYLPSTLQVNISATQVIHSKSAPERWRMSLVEVSPCDDDKARVKYLIDPFQEVEVGTVVAKVTADVSELLARASEPV